MLLAFFVCATPVDEVSDSVADIMEELSREQLFQEFSENLKLDGSSGSATRSIDETTGLPLLKLPPDILKNQILPHVTTSDAGKLRLSHSELKSMVESRLKDFSSVAKSCGNKTTKALIKQQWSNEYVEDTQLSVHNQQEAKKVHDCLWAARNWVETLDEPQDIRLSLVLHKPNLTAGFLSDKNLFEVTDKVRFRIKLSVEESHGLLSNLFQALLTNGCIQSLDLRGNFIRDKHTVTLAAILKKNTVLVKLDLGLNGISVMGAKALAELLAANTALLELNLDFNNIGSAGVEAIAESLKNNTKLERLCLKSNFIGPQGAIALAAALNINKKLQVLDLFYNGVSDEGAEALADALKTNPAMLMLDLGENEVGRVGAMAFADVLIHDNALQELVLKENNIHNQTKEELQLLAEKKVTKNGKPFILQI